MAWFSSSPAGGATLLAGSVAAFTTSCDELLAQARTQVEHLKRLARGHREALTLYDGVTTSVATFAQRAGLAREVHPDPAFREAAETCEQRLEIFSVELSQDRGVFEALSAVDAAALDATTSFWLFKTLRDFRRAGVDRDDATRARVRELNEALVKLGQAFGRNIRDDVRSVLATRVELDGLPDDWFASRTPDAEGRYAVTTNTPDYLPVMTYATNAAVREALWRAYRQRAFPANVTVLSELLARRHDLATLLGYESWAAFATETKMVKTPQAARDFIERGKQSTAARATVDLQQLLARKQRDLPAASALEPWEFGFYEDRVKAESYGLDSQALRSYFEYSQVKRGVMETTAALFSIRYQPVESAATWHPEVETYDVYDLDGAGAKLGRIHLDMHPREGKYKHAAEFGLTIGRLDHALPEAVLVCNFPRPGGLLQHSEVETFFHEFGHLLHEIFGGQQPWGGVSGIRTEWDFVEVPSMLLEEFPLDATVLAGFAKHVETGAVIPAQTVAQLKRAREFGVGLAERRQFFLADLSLTFHQRPPGFDTNQTVRELQAHYAPIRCEWVEGTHFELGFGHLDGYSATYYTYLWSTVIAKDLLTRPSLLNPRVATEYRRRVLEPGGSREAATLVESFLGRPYSFSAFEAWLGGV
jgi:thimet oligopeptidase